MAQTAYQTTTQPSFGRKVAAAKAKPPGTRPPATPRGPSVSTAGHGDIVHGALWLAGGIAVTLGTYQMAASHGGGTYMVASGAMIVGALRLARGALRSFAA